MGRRRGDEQHDEPEAAPDPSAGVRVGAFTLGQEEYVALSVPVGDAGVDDHGLTEAELAVVQGVLDGHSNAEIAQARATSPRTIANQLASIFRKLGVGSRAELVAVWAARAARGGRGG